MLPAHSIHSARRHPRARACRRVLICSLLAFVGGFNFAAAQALEEPGNASLVRIAPMPLPEDISRVVDGSFGPRGTLAVTSDASYVIEYDPLLATFTRLGRRGEGPGEFRVPGFPFWIGDTLAIFDGLLRRVSLFSGGRFTGSKSLVDWTSAVPVALLGPERWLAVVHSRFDPRHENVHDTVSTVLTEGAFLDGARTIAKRDEGVVLGSVRPPDGPIIQFIQPISNRAFSLYAPIDHAVTVIDAPPAAATGIATLRVTRYSLDGRPLGERAFDLRATRRGPAVQSRLIDSLAAQFNRRNKLNNENLREALAREVYSPPFEPLLRWAQMTSKSRIWVWIDRPGSASGALCKIPASRESLICAALPANHRPLAVSGDDTVVLLTTDTDGIPQLVRFKFTAGS